MSKQNHIIHRQVVEVEVPSVEGAWEIQNRISNYYQYSLQDALSEMFDSITDANETLRIDKLEIDLGQLKSANLEEEINAKIKDILNEKLIQLKQKAEGNSAGKLQETVSLRKDSSRYSSIDFVIHFLRTGTAPWWYIREEMGSVHDTFKNLIEKKPQLVKSFFAELLRDENIRKRITHVFSDKLILKFVRIFSAEIALPAEQFLNRIMHSEIGIRYAGSSASDSVSPDKKRTSGSVSPVQEITNVRTEFLELILKNIPNGNNSAFRRYFETHEILLPDSGLRVQIDSELKQIASLINLQLKIVLLDKSSNLIQAKPAGKKRRRIRRKRTLDNLKREEDYIVDENGNVISEEEFSETDFIDSDSISDEYESSSEFTDETAQDELKIAEGETENLNDENRSAGENQAKKKSPAKNKLQRKSARKKKSVQEESIEPNSDSVNAETDFSVEDESVQMVDPEQQSRNATKDSNLNPEVTRSAKEQNTSSEFQEETTKSKSSQAENAEKLEQKKKVILPELLPEDLADFVVDNAGLVLAWPYLGAFFRELGLVSERKFVNEEAAARAVHLLQYISDNGEFEYEEHDLVLNKILCGIEITEPINMHFEITETEKEEVEGLLAGIRSNWNALGSTSNNGLRISFLRKEGSLKKTHQGWNLSIERTTIDMLLDRLPWSISIIRLPWSKDLLYVEW